MNFKRLFKKIALIFVYGVISSGIAYLIASWLTKDTGPKVYDAMTIIGIFIMIIGAFAMVGGNPTGLGPIGTGLNSQQVANFNIEVTRMERETTGYFKSSANHTKLYFTISKLNIILNGAFIIFSSIMLGYLY